MCCLKNRTVLLILLVVLLVISSTSHAQEVKGVVYKIIDGDSIVVRLEKGKKIEVRLYGIDSPEYDQPYSKLSKRYLVQKVLKKAVFLNIIDIDRYKRQVAMVRQDKLIINSELVKLGYAWVYPKYCKKDTCKVWKKYQKKAKKSRKGLWKDKKPTSPWQWKHK